MGNFSLRKEVRKIISELNQNIGSATYGGFPYDDPHVMPQVPQDINPEKEYVWDFTTLSNNQDMFEFPEKEFKLGMAIEKQKNNIFNILDIAELVINNLKQDSKFYSNLVS